MANMTFKASLLPSSDLGYSLGSSTKQWNIYGILTGNASTATAVKQNQYTISNTAYRILLSGTATDNEETTSLNKSSNLQYNPYLNKLSTGNLQLTGELDVTGNTYLHNQTTIDSLTAGSLIVNGSTNFVQSPTAPTPISTSNDTTVATTAFVTNAVSQGFSANDAMVFKGTIGNTQSPINATRSNLPSNNYSAGWTYRVVTANTYLAGTYCEVGDLIIAIKDGPSSGSSVIDADWTIAQTNIDGAVYMGHANQQIGNETTPVYVNEYGQVLPGTQIGASAYHSDNYYVKRSGDTMTGTLFATNILPSTNAYSLGSFANQWKTTYTGTLYITSPNSRYHDIEFNMYASPNTRAALFRYDAGNATNISSGQFSFYQYSPNETANTEHSGYYERFYLPTVATGLTANKSYSILTTKNPLYANCATAAGTAAKVATITGFQLVDGAVAYISFTNTNTNASPTLNISSTGAKAIFDQHGTRITASYGHYLQAGKIYELVYQEDANDGAGAYIIINNPHVLELYENRSVTTGLNKAAGYGGLGSMFHILATSKITDKTNNNKCSFDAHVLQMTWDNTTGNNDAQLALATSAQRMQFRTGTASTSAWQEVAHAPTALNTTSNEAVFTGVGSSSQPVYMNSSGVITAITGAIGNSTTGNAATATQLANSRTLWGQSFNGAANVSGSISGAGNITPTTTITSNIGSASLRWNNGYFGYLFISDNENYIESTSAVNGITLSGDGGWIDLTSPNTSTTPHIDFKLNKSALDYQVRLESDSPGRITIKRDTANVTTGKADPNKAAANVTYNNRSIDPVFQVTGLAHFSSGINAATYLFNNSAAGGDSTGYYLAANNVTSGRLFIATRGLASVSDGADPPTYTDTPGRTVLQLGNSLEGRPTIGVNDNATGVLRLYGESTCFHDIRPSTAVRQQISYLPQYYTGTNSSTSTYYLGRLAAIYEGTAAGEDGFSDVGSISQPVYVTKEGIIKATDSFMRSYTINAYYNATSRSWKKVATLSVDALPKLTGGTSAWIILQFFHGTTYDTTPMGTLRALIYRKDTDTSGVTTNTAITLKLDWIDCNLEGYFENYKLVYTLTDNPTVEDSGNKDLTVDLWVKVNKNYETIICKELAEGKWSVNYPFGTFWTLSDSAAATGTTVDKAAGFTTDPAPEGTNAVTSTYFISKGATGYLTYYSSDKTLAKTSFAHFNWKTGTTTENGYEELVLGNSAASGTDNNAFGRLALYSTGTTGQYIISSGSSWKNHVLPDAAGWLVTAGNGYSTGAGAADRPVYISTAGVATQTTYRMAATNASATTALPITDNLNTGIWYVNGTNSTDLYNQSDGAAYVNKYSDSWIAEIYQDYRTGQLAIRGKNNGTWQAWRKVLDSSNYTTYALTKNGTAGDIVYWSANNTPTHLAKGTDGQVLKLSNGVPVWSSDNNSITGVKGNAESSYRTGQINLTPANIHGIGTTEQFWRGDNTWSSSLTGNLTLAAASGNSPALVFTRDGSLTDWKIFVTSGKLSFQSATDASTWTERAYFKDNSGDFVVNSLTANNLTASQAVSTDANNKLVSTNLSVTDPTASGTGITYIATISQSAVGKITVTKSTVRSASTSQTGVVQLNNTINSTSTAQAATANAVKTAYDLANTANTTANNHKYWANVESTSAAQYDKEPVVKSVTVGNGSGETAPTQKVQMVYDATLEVLNFVFS